MIFRATFSFDPVVADITFVGKEGARGSKVMHCEVFGVKKNGWWMCHKEVSLIYSVDLKIKTSILCFI